MEKDTVLIIGGGVSGLTAAVELTRLDMHVLLVEKEAFLGGHAVRLSCKATTECVQCGVCMVEEKLAQVKSDPSIRIFRQARVIHAKRHIDQDFIVTIRHFEPSIDAEKCTNCGKCYEICPMPGAVTRGESGHHHPFYAINAQKCLLMTDCSRSPLCQTQCPENAIHLNADMQTSRYRVNTVILATGFSPYAPLREPYGYNLFPNVITNLTLENMLRQEGRLLRPSDHQTPKRIVFVQCTGSRNVQLGHHWCSQYCCGSSLRLANLIHHQQPDTQIAIFHIDLQNPGMHGNGGADLTDSLDFIRTIPGDIFETENHNLKITFFDPETGQRKEAEFDLVVLAIGMMPSEETMEMTHLFGVDAVDGMWKEEHRKTDLLENLFLAGTTCGPMTIADAITQTNGVVNDIWQYMNRKNEDLLSKESYGDKKKNLYKFQEKMNHSVGQIKMGTE